QSAAHALPDGGTPGEGDSGGGADDGEHHGASGGHGSDATSTMPGSEPTGDDGNAGHGAHDSATASHGEMTDDKPGDGHTAHDVDGTQHAQAGSPPETGHLGDSEPTPESHYMSLVPSEQAETPVPHEIDGYLSGVGVHSTDLPAADHQIGAQIDLIQHGG